MAETKFDEYGLPIEKGDEGWLPCMAWSGEGDDLPAGCTGMPGIWPWKLVKAVIILDAESDAGVKRIKLSEYRPEDMDILDVVINDASYKAALKQHPKGFTFKGANGGEFNRDSWRAKFGNDALHLRAIFEINKLYHIKEKSPVFVIGDNR